MLRALLVVPLCVLFLGVPVTAVAQSVQLDVPLDVPNLTGFGAVVPVGADTVEIILSLRYDEKGKIVADGASTVDGAPVTVSGSVKSAKGLIGYSLSLKGTTQKVTVKIKGTFGGDPTRATISYSGPKGKGVSIDQVVELAASNVQAALTFTPVVDLSGNITGTGTIVSGYGNDSPLPVVFKGKNKGDALSFSLKSGKQSASYKGLRSGDVFLGALKYKLPPAKGTKADFSVPDFIPKGDGVDGAALFASNCAGCHGADGSGGFGPNLRGKNASALSNAPSGVAAHSVIETFTNEELTAIAAFLSQ